MFKSFKAFLSDQNEVQTQYPSYRGYQTQAQSYARRNTKKQKEKVAFAQSFQDQTDAAFKHLENVLKMLNAGDVFEEDVINLTTDMLIDSINLFAKNCHYCRENKNIDALKLAKKLIIDKWTKFSKKNKKKSGKYYQFMMAALDSTKLIQINQERELTAHELKLQRKALSNPMNLNSGFAKVIGSGSRYEKKSAKYYEDNYNRQLETEHSRQLKQYKNNPKYNQDDDDNKQINCDVNDGANSFYFTKSGKQSKFKNSKRRKETDDLDDVLMGGCGNDDDSKSTEAVAINAVVQCSRKNALGQHWKTSPCLILAKPTKRQSKYHIRMAVPFASEEYWVHPEQFQISTKETYVSNVEDNWMAKYGTYLGYDSIEQRNNPNLDEDDENDNDMSEDEEEDDEEEYEEEEEEVAINGMIKLSKNCKLGRHARTMPCLILSEPNQNERKYHIRLPAPYEKETHWVSPGKYLIQTKNEKFIAKIEREHANYHQVPLGYNSVEQKQQEMYPDV